MPLHALEFVLSPEDDARVRADWDALALVGPSQAHHRGATNAPHVTAASAAAIPAAAEEQAAALLGPLLPMEVRVAGLVILGRGPFTLAWLLAPSTTLAEAVDRCRASIGDAFDGPWLPHLTLARRVPAAALPAATEVMSARPRTDVELTGLRRWDPDTSTVHPVAPTPTGRAAGGTAEGI